MQSQIANFQYDESYLAHGYKELTIPPGPDGSWQMEKNALHIWPRKSFMMIALPNPDGSFTCTLFWEFEGPRSFATTKTDDDVRRFFEEEFPDAVPFMPTLLEDFRENPTGSLVTIRCAPWFYKDKVCARRRRRTRGRAILRPGNERRLRRLRRAGRMPGRISRRTGSAHSPNIFVAEKRTPTRLPILRSAISSRCETRPRRKHFARKRNSITCSKPPCPECICRFTQWSLSHEFLIQRRRDVLDCKTEFFTPLFSRFCRSES